MTNAISPTIVLLIHQQTQSRTSMQPRQLAIYAYHNCEFELALHLARDKPAIADFAALQIKIYCELDQTSLAIETAEAACLALPEVGALHYLKGMAYYLGGCHLALMRAAFTKALTLSYAGGHMGLAFLAFAEKRRDQALDYLERAESPDQELEHIRLLMLFQILAATDAHADAEIYLHKADELLARWPSLLRHYWGQLCWVRYWRGQGRFDAAAALLDRLSSVLGAERTPRLCRNALEARRLITSQDSQINLIMPKSQKSIELGQRQATDVAALALPAAITRKPMLNMLFHYLNEQGARGASKEDIVTQVWEENYNPTVHDDRIYKAVGRLRKLLGDDLQAPRFLTQKGRNYILTLQPQ